MDAPNMQIYLIFLVFVRVVWRVVYADESLPFSPEASQTTLR